MNTQKIILDGMCRLMKNKRFENITVQKVLDECGVSRSTFYRYYKDKYDLMNDYYKFNVEMMLGDLDELGWENVLANIFEFVKHNWNFFNNAAKVEGPNSFWNFLYDYAYKFYSGYLAEDCVFNEIMLIQTIAGEVEVVKKWVAAGCDIEPATLSHYLCKLLPPEIDCL